jgi:hypothetical protein
MELITLQSLQDQIQKLFNKVGELEGLVNKNNFNSTQTFNKACIFSDRLRIPVFSSAPTTAEIGDVFSDTSGKVYVCTTASVGGAGAVWTLIGSQV